MSETKDRLGWRKDGLMSKKGLISKVNMIYKYVKIHQGSTSYRY